MELFVVKKGNEVIKSFPNKLEAKAFRNEQCGQELMAKHRENPNTTELPYTVSKGKDHRLAGVTNAVIYRRKRG